MYWTVDFRGLPLDTRKKTYAQAFTVYGLAEYAAAASDTAALGRASELMETVVHHCRDTENGGYFESFTRGWTVDVDQRLSDADLDEKKSMNAHLHLLEACAALVRLQPGGPARPWLRELVEIFLRASSTR